MTKSQDEIWQLKNNKNKTKITNTVNAYTNTEAFHTQSKKHKYYKRIHQYEHGNQKSTSTVNAYTNTKAFPTQLPTIWLHTDTDTLTLTPTHAHTHTPTHCTELKSCVSSENVEVRTRMVDRSAWNGLCIENKEQWTQHRSLRDPNVQALWDGWDAVYTTTTWIICSRCMNIATEGLSQRLKKSHAVSLEECCGQLCRRQRISPMGREWRSVLSSRHLVMWRSAVSVLWLWR